MARKDPWRAAQASALGKKNAAAWQRRPRCGACAKSTGKPCQRPGFGPSGRCHQHGGLTPRGDNWHRPRWPRDPKKLNAKLRDLERAAVKRQRKIAAMSPEERERWDHWHETHRPGPAAPRAAARRDRRRRAVARKLLDSLDQPREPSPEVQALERLRRELEARRTYQGVFE
jgi:hypothetical protein